MRPAKAFVHNVHLVHSVHFPFSSFLRRTHAVEALRKTAFFREGLGKGGQLAVQQGAGHADKGQGRVGSNFGVARCRCVATSAVSFCTQRIVPNSPDPGCHLVGVPAAPGHMGRLRWRRKSS